MRCGRYSVIYFVVTTRNVIVCAYIVWVVWKYRTRFLVDRGWEDVCYILDEGIFFIPMYGLFLHIPRVSFYTGRLVTMVSADNLRYR